MIWRTNAQRKKSMWSNRGGARLGSNHGRPLVSGDAAVWRVSGLTIPGTVGKPPKGGGLRPASEKFG